MMKVFARQALAAICFALASVAAQAAPASDASIEQLLTVTRLEKLSDSMLQNMQGLMQRASAEAMQGQTFSAEGQKRMAIYNDKLAEFMKSELSYQSMKSLYVQVYRESFSQEEIDGLLAFYATPTGQAYIDKMPLVMQRTMALTQERMAPMMQRLKVMMQQAIEEARAAK